MISVLPKADITNVPLKLASLMLDFNETIKVTFVTPVFMKKAIRNVVSCLLTKNGLDPYLVF